MSVADRPPLHPIACEQIDMLLHRIDEQHWPLIAFMQVAKFIPLSTPVPSRAPLHLLSQIQSYAGALFKAEADQYDQFRSDPRYPAWLSRLEDRVLARVLDAIEKIEQSNLNVTILYHGIGLHQIEKALRESLVQFTTRYTWNDRGPATPTQTTMAGAPAVAAAPAVRDDTASIKVERAALRDSYRAAFPDVKIADIIWAAQQTRREWTRWIAGEAKNGLKPDRSFRFVLTSGKKPEEIRGKPRPTKYSV